MIRRFAAPLIGGTLLLAGLIAASLPTRASQNSCIMPTTGTVSGLTLVQDINACNGSVLSLFSGAAAPTPPTTGMLWYNTGSGLISEYDGTSWNAIWTVDAANHLTAVQIGGGVQATIASASVTDLWSTAASSVSVTGATTITQLANGNAVPGSLKVVTFAGVLTLTQGGGAGGAPLNLNNGGSNITTAAGDYCIVLALTSTNVQALCLRATGAAISSAGLSLGASGFASSALGSFESPINMQVNAVASGGILTIAIKGVNGSDPSSTNPVLVGFRSQTTNSGINVFGSLQAPTSFALATTSSLGCTTAVLCRLWGELICQTESAGQCTSILVGLSAQSTAFDATTNKPACYPLLENVLQNTGSGTSGGTSANVIYTSVSSLSSKAIRIAFYVEAIWTSGGGWSIPINDGGNNSIGLVQLFGPGIKKPCDIVQIIEGSGGISITPTSSINLVRVDATIAASGSTGTPPTAVLHRGGLAIGTTQTFNLSVSGVGGTFANIPFALHFLDSPNTSSSQAYSAAVTNLTAGYTMSLWEIMGALEPANDDGPPALPRAA